MRFGINRVSEGEYQVVDNLYGKEFCVCSTYEGELLTAEHRAMIVSANMEIWAIGELKK